MRAALFVLLLLVVFAMPATGLAFVDAADDAGLDWVHASTTGADQNYPETNGSGLCWGDIDGDGTDDLFLVNGLYADDGYQAELDPRSALYLNWGDGRLHDATAEWNADLSGWGQGCSLADYDGDGDLDVLVIGYDMLVLLQSDGSSFTDATAASGLTLLGNCDENPHCFGSTSSWGDYDGDGDLDVYITQYADYDIDAGTPVSPALYNGMSNILFRNRLVEDGVATFDDVTDLAGVRDNPGPNRSKSFQSAWADCDQDGDLDLYVASDTTPNTLFRNNGDGTFADESVIAGVDDAGASMGLVFQDIDHDGFPDLYFTHYEQENNGFYLNDGDCTYTRRTGQMGLGTDVSDVGWGTGTFDFNNDGRADIFAVNGHTTPMLRHEQEPRLWIQHANGTFEDVSDSAGPAFGLGSVGRGAAVSDLDLDGDLDIALLAHYNETARLLRNDDPVQRFLQIELRQGGVDPYAIGAEVTVTPLGGTPYTRTLQSGNAFLGQHTLMVHAGLGPALTADIEVEWPDGTVESWTGLAADQRVRLTRGVAGVVTDTISPLTEILVNGLPPSTGWYNVPATVSMAASDRAVGTPGGVAALEIDTGDGWGPYAGTVTYLDDGVHTLRGRALDTAGNQEPPRTFRVGIDRNGPTTLATVTGTLGAGGWYRDEATVKLTASDTAAGVDKIWHRVDGGDWTEGARIVLNTSGLHTIDYYAVDRAGNAEGVSAIEVPVDAEAPVVALREKPVALGVEEFEIFADPYDETSGIFRVAFYVDDDTAPAYVDTDGGDGWSWPCEDGTGIFRVTAVAYDRADHTAEDSSYVVHVDIPLMAGPAPLGWLPLGLLPAFSRLRRRFPPAVGSFMYPAPAGSKALEVV